MIKLTKSIKEIIIIIVFWGFVQISYSQVLPDTIFNNFFRLDCGGWIAGDATFSIDLPNNKTLWLFGDSFIGTVNPDSSIAPGASMIRNCAILQENDSLIAYFGGTFESPEEFVLTPNPDSSWFWPEHGLLENDTLKIFMSEFIHKTGAPGFSFKYNDLYIANFTWPEIEFINTNYLPYYNHNNVCYGDRIIVEDEYTYIYGRKETDTVYHIPYPHIARVAAGNILLPWQFFNGNSWVDDPQESVSININPVSQQYCVFKHENKFVMLSQEIWLSTKIHSYTAEFPEGPWENKQLLYETPILFENTFTYNAYAHPQFIENNKLLVSYNSNGSFGEIFNNVEIYRPRFIRVPMNIIDTAFSTNSINPINHCITKDFKLFQNYPNPVVDLTTFKFEIKKELFISLKLFDIKGQELKSFINKKLYPGKHKISVNLSDLKQGLYYYKILNQSFILLKN